MADKVCHFVLYVSVNLLLAYTRFTTLRVRVFMTFFDCGVTVKVSCVHCVAAPVLIFLRGKLTLRINLLPDSLFLTSVSLSPRAHLKPAVKAIPVLPPFLTIACPNALNLSLQNLCKPTPYSTYGFTCIFGNSTPFAFTLLSFIRFHTIPTLAYGCHPSFKFPINLTPGFICIASSF